MEPNGPNLPIVARRVWNIVRVMYYMLKKSISKGKLIVDLNMMMKRGKIAGKAIQNLMLHHHHQIWASTTTTSNNRCSNVSSTGPQEYEFSCSNTPRFPFNYNKKHKHHHHAHFLPCVHAPPTDDDFVTVKAVKKALERLNSEAASPALPGFGRTPVVRQLRITDSPFPLRDVEEEDGHLDEAAEEFIVKFYNNLRQQNNFMGV